VTFRQFIAVAFVHSRIAQVFQEIDVSLLIRRTKYGIQFAFAELNVNAIGNFLRPRDGVIEARETGIHFIRRADVQTVVFHPHAFFIIARCASIDAQHNVLDFGV
jgi:hypothetical protein